MSRGFVIFNRDGTLIVERHYLFDPNQVKPIAGEALGGLRQTGWGLITVTNEAGFGKGYFTLKEVEAVHDRIKELLEKDSAWLDDSFVCPHRPEEGRNCRKLEPCLVWKALAVHGFYPKARLAVAGKICDIELGKHMRAKTSLMRAGYGVKVERVEPRVPDYAIDDGLCFYGTWLSMSAGEIEACDVRTSKGGPC